MNITKHDITAQAVSILLSPNPPNQRMELELAIAKAFSEKQKLPFNDNGFHGQIWNMFNEVFWDLIMASVITPGIDETRYELPYFRLHSQASENLKRLEQARKDSGL